LSCWLILTFAVWALGHSSLLLGAEPAKDSPESQQREFELKRNEFRISLVSLCGTGVALVFGFWQYRKADKWKRAEFLATEMKEFFDDGDIKNALIMIDWAPRRINLFSLESQNSKDYPKVTRQLQVTALRPHKLLALNLDFDSKTDVAEAEPASGNKKSYFSPEEARIRDIYDRFLDYLERFSSYLQSGLVSKKELDPYLRYWIDDIAAYTADPEEAGWTCAILAYIEFYHFESVQYLFHEYGYDITTFGELFKKQSEVILDEDLARKLREACKEERREPES